ncbi:hypothetical protein WDZ92_41435 [Nostoc sp. NIES-2111]
MYYDWRGRPALMFPTLAYCMDRPGAAWSRVNAVRIEAEAEPLDEDEFWARFAAWNIATFPVQFSPLRDDRMRAPVPPGSATAQPQTQQQQQPQADEGRNEEDGPPEQ